jgi:hypothetical protein
MLIVRIYLLSKLGWVDVVLDQTSIGDLSTPIQK